MARAWVVCVDRPEATGHVMWLATEKKLTLARILRRVVGTARAAVGRRDTEVVCRRRGVTWSLDLDEGVQFALYMGLYERGTVAALRRLCPPDGIVLDIGANVGAQALPLAARLAEGGRVIAVEPADQAYGRLRQNIALNPSIVNRVQPLHLALVEEGGRVDERYLASWPLTASARREAVAAGHKVHPVHQGAPHNSTARAFSLDALNGGFRVDLIKLDVDGHELTVLRRDDGLARLEAIVIFEFYLFVLDELGESPHVLSIFDEARSSLHNQGSMAPIGPHRDRLIRAIPHGGGINIVALPR